MAPAGPVGTDAAAAAATGPAGRHPRSWCEGYVALTFDDGPSPTTADLLAALEREGLRATMFNRGDHAQARPELVRAQREAGMWVANHTYGHPHLLPLDEARRGSEIARTQRVLSDITHQEPTLFRPPYGETDDAVRAAAGRLGLLEVLWTVDSRDWDGAGADEIVAAAATLTDGGILLMHDWPPSTVEAVAQVLRDRGLGAGRIVSTSEPVPFGGTTFFATAVEP